MTTRASGRVAAGLTLACGGATAGLWLLLAGGFTWVGADRALMVLGLVASWLVMLAGLALVASGERVVPRRWRVPDHPGSLIEDDDLGSQLADEVAHFLEQY